MPCSETENFSEKVVRFPLSALACGEKKNCHIDLRNWPHQQVLSALPFSVGMISRRKEERNPRLRLAMMYLGRFFTFRMEVTFTFP